MNYTRPRRGNPYGQVCPQGLVKTVSLKNWVQPADNSLLIGIVAPNRLH